MRTMQVTRVPAWVPDDVRRYLEHTERGRSIRQIARLAGCHPSTVMRQIRRVESLRDDPLIDSGLSDLSHLCFQGEAALSFASADLAETGQQTPDHTLLEVLGWLNRAEAVLAYAQGMERAVIVRGENEKISVRRSLAGEVAIRGWLDCFRDGRIARYKINDNGRHALSQMMASQENHARLRQEGGFAEAAAAFSPAYPKGVERLRRARVQSVETPLTSLLRLSDRNGDPFLTGDLVRAGERLREDFELAQIGDHVVAAQEVYAGGCMATQAGIKAPTEDARNRAMAALAALGPGLSDIAIRCCCYLEGLEAAEKQLGWSARSGKVVLRIALQQLKRHYDEVEAQEILIG